MNAMQVGAETILRSTDRRYCHCRWNVDLFTVARESRHEQKKWLTRRQRVTVICERERAHALLSRAACKPVTSTIQNFSALRILLHYLMCCPKCHKLSLFSYNNMHNNAITRPCRAKFISIR